MKLKKFKKTAIIIVSAVFIFLLSFYVNILGVPVGATYKNKKLPIYAVDTTENKVAISFDAAWGADKTKDIIKMCNAYNVKATFFLVGFWVEAYPDMVKEIYNNGFEIGLHSNTHPNMTKLNVNQMKQELETNINLIKQITGVKPTLFRPPFGAYNNNLIDVCDELGLYCIQWDVDSLDWKGLTANQIAGRVIDKSSNGSIVLFHNNSDNIIGGLKMVLEFYKQKQTEVVPVGELIYKNNYTINNFGIQIKTK